MSDEPQETAVGPYTMKYHPLSSREYAVYRNGKQICECESDADAQFVLAALRAAHVPEREGNTVYVAGPMTGIEDFNFPEFFAAEAALIEAGFTVVNPARLDDGNTGESHQYYLSRDLPLLIQGCSHIHLLAGWADSRGARLEAAVAYMCGLGYVDGNNAITEWPRGCIPAVTAPSIEQAVQILNNSVRQPGSIVTGPDAPTVTNPQGGRQSIVNARLDLFPASAWLLVGKILHYGAKKYGEENWRQIPTVEHLNHALIHAAAHLQGDDRDDHAGHFACRAMMFLEMHLQGESTDGEEEVSGDDWGDRGHPLRLPAGVVESQEP